MGIIIHDFTCFRKRHIKTKETQKKNKLFVIFLFAYAK